VGKIQSINPATGEVVAEIEAADESTVRSAVARARAAFEAWGAFSFEERGRRVLALCELVRREKEGLARLISEENGKPLVESFASDIFPFLDLAAFFAKKAAAMLKPERIWLGKWAFLGRTSVVEYGPIGVVGIIAPGNYPFAIPAGQAVIALMAGNTVVLKPSEQTPRVGLKIGELFQRAGLPSGVLEVVAGDGATGAALVKSGDFPSP